VKITLPYPPAVLNPNSRDHWAKKHRAAKKYKADCTLAILAAGRTTQRLLRTKTNFSLTFCRPDKRAFDEDNAMASMKSGLDALSAYIGIDDSQFHYTIQKGEPVKGGAVIVEVLE
jgi:crossover junction endodeoxyribonuclease RusA